ncbi:hypothetical protein [Streptomyces spongiae]|uniref:hypothetical protein n=1 Tax=Streptomyces spongiae TaxID=565072 RepID=UPI001883A9E5|nr:hypothetical protein [Streptomyces spongiae]
MTAPTTQPTEPADDDTLVTTGDGDSHDTPPPTLTLISAPDGALCDTQGHCTE